MQTNLISEAPRLKHNRELMEAYLRANKVYSRYPKVTEQIECVPLDASKLLPFGYNPSIIYFNNCLLMAYRYHPENTAATKLALFDGNENIILDIPDAPSAEDPKLFAWSDELYMSFVASKWPDMAKSVVRYGRLGRGTLERNKVLDIVQPNYGENDWSAMEKNWIFFTNDDDKLKCIYSACYPTQKMYVPQPMESPGLRWPYGFIRGGTTPLPYEGKWLRFFHSNLDNDMGVQRRRYFVGALLMSPKPPYECVAVSKKPIIYGSELSDVKPKDCFHYKANVVFPGGAIEKDGKFWVSCGVNDSACVIAKVKPENLNL